MADEESGIQGVLIEEVVGVSHMPDGKIALIVRNAEMPVGLVFDPEDAAEAAQLLGAATGGGNDDEDA